MRRPSASWCATSGRGSPRRWPSTRPTRVEGLSMANEHVVKINEKGDIEFVYDDELSDLLKLGDSVVVRASHVEPHPNKTGWLADMRPSGGPVIGANGSASIAAELETHISYSHEIETAGIEPFALREEALAAEREWLRRERGL